MSLLGDAVKDYHDVQGDMNRIMVPLLGLLFALFAIALVILLAIKPRFIAFLKWFLLLLLVFQVFASVFMWFSNLWAIGLQFFAFSLFGIYAIFARDGHAKTHLLVFSLLALLDFFVVIGKVSFMGYATVAIDALTNDGCTAYYNFDHADDAQCTGYVNFLRFLVYLITLGQPLQLFISYLLYRTSGEHSEVGEPSEYGKIGDASSSSQ